MKAEVWRMNLPFDFNSFNPYQSIRVRLPRFRYADGKARYSSFILPPSFFAVLVAESTRLLSSTVARAVADFDRLPLSQAHNLRETTVVEGLPHYLRTSCTGVIRGTPVSGCASTKTLTAKTSLSSSGENTSEGFPKATVFPSFISKT